MRLKGVQGLYTALKAIENDFNRSKRRSMREIAVVIKDNIKAEIRDPNKTGEEKVGRRRKLSPTRRSKKGESFARDSGKSEKLIASVISGNNLFVGFKEDIKHKNYVANLENKWDRPTIANAKKRSEAEIKAIINRNFRP